MKKSIIIFTISFVFSLSLNAQNWQTNFEKSKTLALKNNQPIILVFQGSDWCAPCIKLEKEIWSTETFKNYAEKNVVMLKADFPKRSKNAIDKTQQDHNNALAAQYNKQGYFPYVVVLDHNGKVLGTTGYTKTSPEQFITKLESYYKQKSK